MPTTTTLKTAVVKNITRASRSIRVTLQHEPGESQDHIQLRRSLRLEKIREHQRFLHTKQQEQQHKILKAKHRQRRLRQHEQRPRPPWIQPKTKKRPKNKSNHYRKNKNINHNSTNRNTKNLVTHYVEVRQEEAWNEFAHDILDPLFPLASQDALLQVLECLYYMGIPRTVLESAAHLIAEASICVPRSATQQQEKHPRQWREYNRKKTRKPDKSGSHYHGHSDDSYNEAMLGLAQYLAFGVTRVPTPFGMSQRLALLHVICTFREEEYRRVQNSMQEKETMNGGDINCNEMDNRSTAMTPDLPQQQCSSRKQVDLDESNYNSNKSKKPYGEEMCHSTSIDPVLLWQFLMGNDDTGSTADNQDTADDGKTVFHKVIWGTRQEGSSVSCGETVENGKESADDGGSWSSSLLFVWCWELRALTLACLGKEEAERQWALTTADQVAHAVGMAAITVELGLNQSTELVCKGMGRGCEWVKQRVGSPSKGDQAPTEMEMTIDISKANDLIPTTLGHAVFEEETVSKMELFPKQSNVELQHQRFSQEDDEASANALRCFLGEVQDEEATTIGSETSSSLSSLTNTSFSTCTTTATSMYSPLHQQKKEGFSCGTSYPNISSNQSMATKNSQKTKESIVVDTVTSCSRKVRKATEGARETMQTYVEQFKKASNVHLQKAAQNSRAWATQNVHANHQHWAYLDAFAKVSLASLGAMVLMGDAMFQNTQLLLDHTTYITCDLIQHLFGSTAANVFEDVSRSTTNLTRMTAQLVGLASPFSFTRAVVRHAGKERLRQQYDYEQSIRKQPPTPPPTTQRTVQSGMRRDQTQQ